MIQRYGPILAGVLFGLVLGLYFSTPSSEPVTPGYADAVSAAAPSVVNIYTTRVVTTRMHPLCDMPRFRQFCARLPGRQERMQGSLGSGIIASDEGHVLTNNHVIADADEILIALADGREAEARVVGTDPETDLAVLQIDLDDLQVTRLAPPAELRVGDVVLAIGNPFGIGQTVSQGIVSAIGRYGLSANPYEDFIQTDAAINPGNSGGALVDVHGRLVGLNTLIFSRSGGYQGIGFAIPAPLVFEILEDIVAEGQVIRGWLGVEIEPDSPEGGLIIASITPSGPAHRAGLVRGDVIIAIDEWAVESPRAVVQRIAMMEPGASVTLGVLREDRYLTVDATIGQRPVPG